jgi:hypothetical protein
MVMGSSVGGAGYASAPFITRHSLAEMKVDQGIRLLVAGDNIINQKVAARMLEKLSYRVDVVANGVEKRSMRSHRGLICGCLHGLPDAGDEWI